MGLGGVKMGGQLIAKGIAATAAKPTVTWTQRMAAKPLIGLQFEPPGLRLRLGRRTSLSRQQEPRLVCKKR